MPDDIDTAARLIERLLVDPAFRAEFRRDPAAACRDAGLDELAEHMSYGAGKAMQTLDVRESRSSLAGVMMAAALEGIGVVQFAEHIVPGATAAPGAARDVLSRVNLPTVDGAASLRGALASTPEVPASGGGRDAAANAGEPVGAAAPATPAPQPPPPTATPPLEPDHAHRAAIEPAASPASAGAPHAAGAPVDPAQFGAEGTGGAPSPEAVALLQNKDVVLDSDGIADIKAGRIDPRVVAVLTKLSEDHKITVSCMYSDHPALTAGGSVSNHHFGRGMDIAAIDGLPVNADNPIARAIATELSSLDPSYRPDEIGTPWAISGPGYFTDADHADHLHVAFKQAIDSSWTPPAGQAGASAGAGASAPAGGSSLSSIAVPQHAGAVGEHLVQGDAGTQAAGAKALAALAEATKYKGMPYRWGGSSPPGFDCSGLVQWAYAQQGIHIPRVTDQQILATNGTAIDRKDLVPGDLVFFRDPSGYVHHVGISMGGDTFLHAPHTGDVVKVSSLDEPYYAQQFAGGRRFDDLPAGAAAPAPAPAAVDAAGAALARDAAAVRSPSSMIFRALSRQEASHHSSTVQFMRAVRPEEAVRFQREAMAAGLPVDSTALTGSEYPGDGATKERLAAWLGTQAQRAGLPPELPVMAALVESGLANLGGGDADSVGFFQMRVGIWNTGDYAGYPERPALQAKWFIDHALALKRARIAAGESAFGNDPSTWGNWIADVERPRADLRFRYQLQLERARELLGDMSPAGRPA